jgi:hypothetical protein
MIKEWIKGNCFSKSGSLNNRISLETWWTNKGFSEFKCVIEEETSYLDTDNITQRIYHILNDIVEIPVCKSCKIVKLEFRQFKSGYREYCSIRCVTQGDERNAKISKNNDYDKIFKKVKQTNLEKYGVENYYESEDFKEKAAKTKIERYGDENFNNIEKSRSTCMKKYGVAHTELLKTNHVVFDEVYDLHFNKGKSCVDIAKELNVSFTYITKLIHKNGFKPIIQAVSSHEKELGDFLTSHDICHESSNRKILDGKEIDIYIPETNLGIEINGLYWHSFDKKETTEEINRHINKKNLAESKGIKLIQFTDKEWLEKKDICKSIILTSMKKANKIRASACKIFTPTEDEYREFLINNHIQGYVPAQEKIGLIYNNKIVSIMSIGKSRYTNHDWELLRFVNKKDHIVYGAASKLFNIIKKDNMISYCSLDYFNGKVYEKLGFNFSHITKPNYFYVQYGSKIINRINAQKMKLSKLLKTYDENLTEYQNMFNNGYSRYWNCGNSVWIYNNKGEKLINGT